MGYILVLDGPDKTGKSTLANAVAEAWPGPATVRHWGPIQHDSEYVKPLAHDAALGPEWLTVWDRSWCSEHVYSMLLKRPGRRLAHDPWLGEWLYGRAATARAIVLPRNTDMILERLDDSDPVQDVIKLCEAFAAYGIGASWMAIINEYTQQSLDFNVKRLIDQLTIEAEYTRFPAPPVYAGPTKPAVVMVGEKRNQNTKAKGVWLPFTSDYTTRAGRHLRGNALYVGWTNADDCPPQLLHDVPGLVAYGQVAQAWAKHVVGHDRVFNARHPAALYRWGQLAGEIGKEEGAIAQFVYAHIGHTTAEALTKSFVEQIALTPTA